jgi:hypothetical protein
LISPRFTEDRHAQARIAIGAKADLRQLRIDQSERRKRHRELLHEDRIGAVEMKNDCPRVRRSYTVYLIRPPGLKFRRPGYLAKIFHPFRTRGRVEHALDFVLEVGSRHRAAVGEAGLAAQVKREGPRVGRFVPARCDIRHQVDAAVANLPQI